ncbi:MAG: peptidoglycan DD-metalloendopeptidase family protein [Candidatus Hydrogenedentota bacterium]
MNAIVPEVTMSHRGTRTVRSLQTSTAHTVRKGQTLSSIILDYLKETGQEHSASTIYRGVNAIARANGLSNPDRIQVGQRIQLTALRLPTESFGQAVQSSAEQVETPKANPFHRVLNGPARLTSPYGMREDPIAHDHRKHNGVDLAATRNTPITPMQPGVVTFSAWMRGYGNTIIVEHEGGIRTQYSHAAKRLVAEGERVDTSTVVGLVGATGRATGPHLHFEVSRYGRRVNPMPYLMTEPIHAPRTRLSLST